MVHICVHICTCGCCLRAQQSGGMHTHMNGHVWLCTAPCPQDTSCKPTALTGATSPCPTVQQFDFQGFPGALAAERQPLPWHSGDKGDLVSRQQL